MIVTSGKVIPAEGRAEENIVNDIIAELLRLGNTHESDNVFVVHIATKGLDFGEYMFWWVHDWADDEGYWQTTRQCVYDRETDTEWLALRFERKEVVER